jgi:hypothetical protein
MSGNGPMTLQGDPPVETLSLRVTHLLGKHVNHQGEIRKKIQFLSKCSIIKKRPFATCSNDSIIKVTLTTRPDLLPHEKRLVVLSVPWWCGGCCYVANNKL